MNGGLLQWHVKNTRPTANFGMYSSSGQDGRICLGAEGHRGMEVQKSANSGVIVNNQRLREMASTSCKGCTVAWGCMLV